MINLLAVVGRGGVIGPKNSLPVFAQPEVQHMLSVRARQMTEDGVLVYGSNTARMMSDMGVHPDRLAGNNHCAVWSRSHGTSPGEFLSGLEATGRNIFITGGRTTFRIFAPFCENFFVWRAELLGDDQNVMDPILPHWTHRQIFPEKRVLN